MKRRRKGRRGQYPYGRPRKDNADVIGIGVVDLLDVCVGSRARTGEPISMLMLSREDGIETIAFSLRDTKRLAIHALASLSEFNVPLAKEIFE